MEFIRLQWFFSAGFVVVMEPFLVVGGRAKVILIALLLVALAVGWTTRAHGRRSSVGKEYAATETFLPNQSLYWFTLLCCLGAVGLAYADDLDRKVVLVS